MKAPTALQTGRSSGAYEDAAKSGGWLAAAPLNHSIVETEELSP
jgi:hypothetical protein